MRILVAEDDRITRASLTRQLEAWGHAVTPAEDGSRAWDLFAAGEFDLVVTDWEMPGLSGLELIHRIRHEPARNSAGFVYIIMLTSRSEKGDIVRGIEAGADDFVSKPFDREELRVRVLAGERVVRLERTLSAQNLELREAGERMKRDLHAAARVQRAMLPKSGVDHPGVRANFTYVPTDELAGDALGLVLLDGRYLVSYVVDVTGHGVPAALLAVNVMQALAPSGEGLLAAIAAPGSTSRIVAELNRRFCAGDNDGRFLTMILSVLDTADGALRFTRAGHPPPIVVRHGEPVPLSDDGGLPLGVVDDADYPEVTARLEAADRVLLYSDGMVEQLSPASGAEFGEPRLRDLVAANQACTPQALCSLAIESLTAWAARSVFSDDVSLLAFDWSPGASR